MLLSASLPALLRRWLLANYACPAEDARFAALAFRWACSEQRHASRLCAEACAELLPSPAAGPATCLELGFGAGYTLAELRRLRPVAELRLIGVDASSAAVKLALARLGSSGCRLFRCRADDLLPVATGSCHLVAHVNCVGVMPRDQLLGVYTEAYRVLRADGRLVVAADCQLTGRLVAQLRRPDLLDSLAALEVAGFAGISHSRRQCPLTGRSVHLVTAQVDQRT